jgi:hypothetical protein
MSGVKWCWRVVTTHRYESPKEMDAHTHKPKGLPTVQLRIWVPSDFETMDQNGTGAGVGDCRWMRRLLFDESVVVSQYI